MPSEVVLILDEDQVRGPELVQLLRFAGVSAVYGLDPASEDWRAVLVVEPSAAMHNNALVDLAERKVPLIAVEFGNPLRTSIPLSAWSARLQWPLQHAGLLAALRQADATRPGLTAPDFRPLVGQGAAMSRIRRMVQQVAPSDATVLILGESGTGKEVVARNVHQLSNRRDKPFIPLNCGAIPAELLESELFGHEKGAFTGAFSSRPGRFELAEGGTLFLDEIGDMPMPMQVKLLRVLQERTYERVGGRESRKADVRVIAATHRNLEERIALGEFREDLYYRLNVFPIETAPLRELADDLPLLVAEMIGRLEREGRGTLALAPSALNVLCAHGWPGNVRELANLIERLSILFPDQPVEAHDLPARYIEGLDLSSLSSLVAAAPEVHATSFEGGSEVELAPNLTTRSPVHPALPDDGIDLKAYLDGLEVQLINEALERTDGVVAQAARLLGVRRTTLVEKMRKYQLAREVTD